MVQCMITTYLLFGLVLFIPYFRNIIRVALVLWAEKQLNVTQVVLKRLSHYDFVIFLNQLEQIHMKIDVTIPLGPPEFVNDFSASSLQSIACPGQKKFLQWFRSDAIIFQRIVPFTSYVSEWVQFNNWLLRSLIRRFEGQLHPCPTPRLENQVSKTPGNEGIRL